jgi:phenylacetate-CoA ligase
MVREAVQFALRSSGAFGRYSSLLRAAEGWDRNRLRDVQASMLQEEIRRACRDVPFYTKLFARLGLRPEDIASPEDLSRLPTMDKFTLRSEFDGLRSRSRALLTFRAYTSGTSGTPVVMIRGLDNIRFEHASFRMHDRWAGVRGRVRRCSLVGRMVVPLERKVPPFWKHDPFEGELMMSVHHLSAAHVGAYVEALRRYRPDVLRAYPSTAHIFAHHLLDRGITIPLTAVFTQSEQLSDSQRRDIEAAFQTRVYDRYGSAERVAAFFQCAHGSYHEAPLYSVVEYLPVSPGVFEVVGTSLHNSTMPLLRYRTGDLVELPGDDRCPCGRNLRVVQHLSGRVKDQIVMADGTVKPVRTSELVKGLAWLKESQLLQEAVDRIVLRVVPMPGASVPDPEGLIDRLVHVVGEPRSMYRVEVMDRIPREQSGKLKSVKSLVHE